MVDAGLLAQQRRALILDAVRTSGAVRVAELVDQLGVSDMTIRRDLDALARTGALQKVHGGAVAAPATVVDEPEFEAKAAREAPEKAAMAQAVADLVRPGSVVAIAAGTTAYAVAARLTAVPQLTVVTNSLPVAELLRERAGAAPGPAVLLTGGTPTPSAALVGPLAERAIGTLNFDLLVLGAQGVSERAGLTSPNLAEAQTNRAMIAATRQVVAVVDHTKWGVSSLSSFAALHEIDVFVTDDAVPEDARAVLADTVGELVVVTAAGR